MGRWQARSLDGRNLDVCLNAPLLLHPSPFSSASQSMADAAAEGFGPAASQALAAALSASLDLATRVSAVVASAGSSAAPDDAEALASAFAQVRGVMGATWERAQRFDGKGGAASRGMRRRSIIDHRGGTCG